MNNEQKFKKAFREILKDELSSAQVKRAKKDLISQFSVPAHFLIRPSVLAPAFAVLFAVTLFYQLHQPVPKPEIKEIPVPHMAVQAPMKQKIKKIKVKTVTKQLEKMIRTEIPLDVKVTRISSDTGSTMVYQKTYRDSPVTVVWVFPKGRNQ